MDVVFVGLGNMGSGMAANLIKAGLNVRAVDPSEVARLKAKAYGAQVFDNLASAVEGACAMITMLPSGREVREMAHILAQNPMDGFLWIDCSTIDVETARETHQVMAALGVDFVDAPVSGGVAAANEGRLTFMVGGAEPAFKRASHYLAKMGVAIIHAGGEGAGQAAKICNNMLLAITMIGTCEAFGLARRLGLEDQTFFDIATNASGQNWALSSYCPVAGPVPSAPSNRDYEGGFASSLMLKDLGLAMQAVAQTDAHTPMGAKAHTLYETLVLAGHGMKDFSFMMNRIERGV
jgi:3-hydroxyisobutyrate dehydrogenase